MSEGKQTKLVTAGRDEKWTNGVVNPPVQRASTVVFNTVAEKHHATVNRANKTLFYGRRAPTLTLLSKMQWLKLRVALVALCTHVVLQLFPTQFSLLLSRAIIFLWLIPAMNQPVTFVTRS